MVYNRYAYACHLAQGKRVLEIACGAGLGLGLLRRVGASVIGGDIEMDLLRRGSRHYGDVIPFVQLDAHALPFRAGSFELCLLFEASYYLRSLAAALDEIIRILAPDGTLIIVTANPERPVFIPSPRSHAYHTARHMEQLLTRRGLATTVEGTYAVDRRGMSAWLAAGARRILTAFGLVPKTLKGRALLKRILYGRPLILPPELPPAWAAVEPRKPIRSGAATDFKVLYVTASKR
jgi:SAM-dependent methyltransferase